MKKKIKLLVLDVDGTLTDGKIYIGPEGEAVKAFDVKDGYALAVLLPKMGIEPLVITGRKSEIVGKRCLELGICRVFQGVADKKKVLDDILLELGVGYENVAFMGDDIPDLELMKEAAVCGCPGDAVDAVKKECQFISGKKGGCGAVREFVEWIRERER